MLTQTPTFASTSEQKDAAARANADFNIDEILIAKKPTFNRASLNETENELTQEMGSSDGGHHLNFPSLV